MRRLLLKGAVLSVICSPTAIRGGTEYVGFHGDGTGVYPDANPPVEWGAGKNVVWKTEMPNWSNSQPVAKDGRVYVMSEPVDAAPILLCLDDTDGRVLWRREIDHLDEATQREFSAFYARLRSAVRKAHDVKKVRRPRLSRDLKARGALLPYWGIGNTNPTQPHMPGTKKGYGWQYVGHAFAAPVTDGRRVWVWCFPGVAACFDRSGKRLWQKVFDLNGGEHPLAGGCTFTSAPVVVDGTLVLLGGNMLRGLEPASGEVRWRRPLLESQGWQPAAPKAIQVDGTRAVFCIDGGVYRAGDGKLMASGFGKPVAASTVAHDNTAFLSVRVASHGKGVRHTTRALRFTKTGENAWAHELLWETEGLLSTSHDCLTPVYLEEKIYGSRSTVWDATTGEETNGRFAARYSSPIVAGKYLITRLRKKPRRYAGPEGESYVNVYELATMELLATNVLPAAPVEGAKREQILAQSPYVRWDPNGMQTMFCQGDRLYIRTHDHLWCIGGASK